MIKVVILPADKGEVTVIMDKSDYDIKMADLITMKNILYVKKYPSNQIEKICQE